VQSLAFGIVEREEEIEAFVPREYWTLHLDSHKGAQPFTAKLTHFKGEKLEQFSVEHEARSKEWLAMLEGRDATVMRIEKKRRARHPGAPFTSTLQQAGVRRLGMTDRVMRTARSCTKASTSAKARSASSLTWWTR
jgi:DNA topoisomerase-1